MQTEILMSGFGGQGALFAGQLLAYAAMDSGNNVTWIPSYGPEMRGGAAHCTVIIYDDIIGSPLVRRPQAVLALNLPSLDKFEHQIKPGGVLIANQSLIDRDIARTDLIAVLIPANDIAEELGNKRMTNMVMLGALIACLPILPLDAIKQALDDHLPERHRKLLPANFRALQRGSDFAMESSRVHVVE